MGTIILSDTISEGDGLEYIDMLTIPTKENLLFRFNAFTTTERYEEPDGSTSASQLENMTGIGDPIIGRGASGTFGGGVIVPSPTNSGRPALDMKSLSSDPNALGRFYLFPTGTRSLMVNTTGFTLFMVCSIEPNPSGRFISIGTSSTSPGQYGNLLDVGVNSEGVYFIRASNQGEAYTQSTNGVVHTSGVKVYKIVFNPLTGIVELSTNGQILASVEIPVKNETAWSEINSIRLGGTGNTYGLGGLLLDFLLYTNPSADYDEVEDYLYQLHNIK